MGLSNRERTGKILYSVKEIVSKADQIKKAKREFSMDERLQKILVLCDHLWPSLLGAEQNAIHWLFGSASSNPVDQENEDLWSIAVCSLIPRAEEGVIKSEDDFLPKMGFNPLDSMLSIPCLLKGLENWDVAFVCEIYGLIENIIYALRRYNDNFLKEKQLFSDLVANIQGTCFSILYDNIDFSRCYIAHEIYKILYTDHYRLEKSETYKDVVDEWMHFENMHHDITRAVGRSGENIKWLAEQHLLLLGSEGSDLKKNRVLVAIRMAGRRYHYDHKIKKMFEILAKDKDLSDKNFLDEVKKETEVCKKAKIKDDEDFSKQYKEDNKPSRLYGWNALPKKKDKPKDAVKKISKSSSR